MRRARAKTKKEAPGDPTWASFALYGDPCFQLIETKERVLKPASVLSARIVGLSALYEQLGAEAASEIAETCLSRLQHEVAAYLGEVLGAAHDSVVAAFGISMSDSIRLAKDYSNLGTYAFEMDDWQLAQESYLEALDVLDRIGDAYQLAITNCNLADLYCHQGYLAQGIPYGLRGLTLFTNMRRWE